MSFKDKLKPLWEKQRANIVVFSAIALFICFAVVNRKQSCAQMTEMQERFDKLDAQVSRFKDGQTDWKEIVAELERATDDLADHVEDCECAYERE